VAIKAIDLKSLARNAESRPCKKLLDEISSARESERIIAKIALFEGECFGNLKEASLEIAGASRRQFIHLKKVSEKRCEQAQKASAFLKVK
jgi:hypothetical protein